MFSYLSMGPSINDISHLGGGGDLPKGEVASLKLIYENGWQGGGRGKISQKMGDVIYGWPL